MSLGNTLLTRSGEYTPPGPLGEGPAGRRVINKEKKDTIWKSKIANCHSDPPVGGGRSLILATTERIKDTPLAPLERGTEQRRG